MNKLPRVDVCFHLPVLVASVSTLKYEIVCSIPIIIVFPVNYWFWESTSILEHGLVNPVWLQFHSRLRRWTLVKNSTLINEYNFMCLLGYHSASLALSPSPWKGTVRI